MDLLTLARLSGVLGGLAWVVRWVLDLTGTGDEALLDAFHWGGLALVAVALAGFGAGLVNRSVWWLRAVVAIAFPLLVWSVLEVLHGAGDAAAVDALAGAVVLAVAGIGLARGTRGAETDEPPRRSHRAHRADAR